jgi:type II restriction enzyme
MDNLIQKTIEAAQNAEVAFSKFITANDTGTTGGHQSGYHLHKNSWPLFFDKPGEKGTNSDSFVTIRWQDDFETSSRFTYYGVGTRNEYRLTRFGRGFPYLSDDNVGDLLVICKKTSKYYEAFVLQKDEDIEDFFAAMNISANATNSIIPKKHVLSPEDNLEQCFQKFIKSLIIDFPPTQVLSTNARLCYNKAHNIDTKSILKDPDLRLVNWLDAEFLLFKAIENDRYSARLKSLFSSVEELVETANSILNRRKSRAGKSLEHQLAEIFNQFRLSYEEQVITEDNKKPDFLFPSREAYINPKFDEGKLCVLGSKTTCKDRWRQVLNEADRIKVKHLFTLQQGISSNQLKEMIKYDVQLVVPKRNITSFPTLFRERLWTLEGFVRFVEGIQE